MADPATIETLLGLPVAVWAGIVTASATLLGTLVGSIATNWGGARRLRVQLDHDASEKAKERLLALRRELYLKAVEVNARALGYFGSLPDADFTQPDSQAPIQNILAVGSQLQLVVSQGTAQLVSDAVAEYGELQMKLIPAVLPIHNLRTDIELRSAQYNSAQAEVQRVLALMRHFNESGQQDVVQFERLNRSYEFASEVAQRAAEERSAFWDQKNALHRQYMKDLVPELKRVGEIQIRLLVELRRELDVGGDIEIFKQMMLRQMERMDRALAEFDRNVYDAQSPADNVKAH